MSTADLAVIAPLVAVVLLAAAIVYEDKDLLVLNKPAGMVVHPAPGHPGGTLVNALLAAVPTLSGIGGEVRRDPVDDGFLHAGFADEADATLRQITQPAVQQAAGPAAGAKGKIVLLHQADAQSAQHAAPQLGQSR